MASSTVCAVAVHHLFPQGFYSTYELAFALKRCSRVCCGVVPRNGVIIRNGIIILSYFTEILILIHHWIPC